VVGLSGGDIGVLLGPLVAEDTAVIPLNVRASGLAGGVGSVRLPENLTVREVCRVNWLTWSQWEPKYGPFKRDLLVIQHDTNPTGDPFAILVGRICLNRREHVKVNSTQRIIRFRGLVSAGF